MGCRQHYKLAEDVQEWDYETRRIYWSLPVEVRKRFHWMMKQAAKAEAKKRGGVQKT